jgi:hypothetical protein
MPRQAILVADLGEAELKNKADGVSLQLCLLSIYELV